MYSDLHFPKKAIYGDLMSLANNNKTSWLHRASTILNPLLLPTDAHNVKKRRVIKTF